MVTGSARLGPLSDCTPNCKSVLSSERAPHRNKIATFRQEVISDRKSHKGARHQDILTDWLSVDRKVTSTAAPVEERFDYWKRLLDYRLPSRLTDYWLWLLDLNSSWVHWIRSCCGWVTGPVREPIRRGTSAVGSRYQRSGEEITDREDSVCAAVKCRMCELAIAT
jgi:hypothetical protein